MKKVVVTNCEDGKDSLCYLTEKKFKTSHGVAYLLNGRVISPEEGLKMDLEFDPKFVTPPNFNTRLKIGEYLRALGINRNHPSYFSALAKLSDGLPTGEYPKYTKEEHT